MTKEISKELIAKVFMLYPGAEVKVSESHKRNRLVGVVEQKCHIRGSQGVLKIRDIELCQLILSDLSDISDEDAVEVAKMAGYDDCKGRDLRVGFWQGHYRRIINLPELTVTDDCYSTDSVKEYPIENPIQIIDFLRSRGYMLPAFGIPDLFEAGIAVRKNKEV